MTFQVEDLALRRGGKPVLQQVSVAPEKGQITAVCGPNGVGKSTLVMGLAGLIEPDGGRIVLENRKLGEYTPRERAMRIGYLPQSAEVAWDVSVENLVRLGRLPHRDRGDEAVEAAIAALELQELRKRPASQLSGGERSRVLLARVLAGEPDWILADEPFAALDLAHQQRLLTHFKASAQKGQGVVLVLHDLALAMNHADRVIVLGESNAGGVVVADGPPDQALSISTIADVWGVDARWMGNKGASALLIG